jgi:hypothetical protein
MLLIGIGFIAAILLGTIIWLIAEINDGVEIARVEAPFSNHTFFVFKARSALIILSTTEIIMLLAGYLWLR